MSQLVVGPQQVQIPVGPPQSLADVALGSLEALCERPLLRLVQPARRLLVVVDALPRQCTTDGFANVLGDTRHGEDEGRLECAADRPALPHDRIHERHRQGIDGRMVEAKRDERQGGATRHVVGACRKHLAVELLWSSSKELLGLLGDPGVDLGIPHGAAAGDEDLIEVRLETDAVAVLIGREVEAGTRQSIENVLHIRQIRRGRADGHADFRERGISLCRAHATVGLKQNGRCDLTVQGRGLDRFPSLPVEPLGVGLRAAVDVRNDGYLKLVLAELLKHGRAEELVVKGGRPKHDERVLRRFPVLVLIGVGHPEGQEPQDAAGALEPRETLPLPLEHR